MTKCALWKIDLGNLRPEQSLNANIDLYLHANTSAFRFYNLISMPNIYCCIIICYFIFYFKCIELSKYDVETIVISVDVKNKVSNSYGSKIACEFLSLKKNLTKQFLNFLLGKDNLNENNVDFKQVYFR